MNDYYIGVDQNGQPYISHANPLQTAAASVRSAGAGLGRGVRRYHKYLMKIGEGAKARYLYTQQEVQAYMRGGRKALDQIAKNTKENARKGLTAASDKVRTTGKNVKNKASDAVEYAKDNSKQLLNVRDDYIDAKRTHKGTKSSNPVTARLERKRYSEDNTLGGKVYKTQQAVKEKIGNDARKDVLEKKADLERAKELTKGSREAYGSEDLLTKGFSKMVREREKQLNAAERKYDKTLLGKAEGTADKAKETGKSAISNVKSASDRMKEEFRKKKDAAKDVAEGVKAYREWDKNPSKESFDAVKNNKTASGIREARNNLHDKLDNMAWKAAKGLEGADVRKQFEKASDEFQKNPTPENKQKRDELYDKWVETPHGKFINNEFIAGVQQNGLKDTVKDAVDEGKSRIKDSVKSTSDRMKEEFRKKKDEAADKLGVDEKKRLNDALDYRDRTMNMARSDSLVTRNFSKDAKQKETAQKMVDERREEYYKTPLGKVSKAKNDAENKIDDGIEKASNKINQIKDDAKKTIEKIERERDFKNAPKNFERLIKETAKNKGISEEEVKQDLIEWTKEYYSGKDNERLDRYLEAINSVNTSKKK